MVTAKKFVLVRHFDGFPKRDDLQLVEEELPSLKDGGTIKRSRLSCSKVNFFPRISSRSALLKCRSVHEDLRLEAVTWQHLHGRTNSKVSTQLRLRKKSYQLH